MNIIAVAFTTQETNELFLTIVKASTFEEALYKAIAQSVLYIPSPEKYQANYDTRMTYIQFCKTACNIDELAFNRLNILVEY